MESVAPHSWIFRGDFMTRDNTFEENKNAAHRRKKCLVELQRQLGVTGIMSDHANGGSDIPRA